MSKINATQILPIAMILLDVGAAAVCLWHKDHRRAVYWLAAAVLTSSSKKSPTSKVGDELRLIQA